MSSWKGIDKKSGGVATNIGVHFYDMLHYIFGAVLENKVHYRDAKTIGGFLKYERARVHWLLSIDAQLLPENAVKNEKATYRSITIAGEELEFSGGFTDPYTRSYEHILAGNGYSVDENRTAIETVETIRNAEILPPIDTTHHLLAKVEMNAVNINVNVHPLR